MVLRASAHQSPSLMQAMVVGGSDTAVVETVRVGVGVALLFVSVALYKTIIRYANSAVKKHTGDSQ
jgi:hypothetical protein